MCTTLKAYLMQRHYTWYITMSEVTYMRQNKYIFQTRNVEVSTDVKEQIWLPNEKYL